MAASAHVLVLLPYVYVLALTTILSRAIALYVARVPLVVNALYLVFFIVGDPVLA